MQRREIAVVTGASRAERLLRSTNRRFSLRQSKVRVLKQKRATRVPLMRKSDFDSAATADRSSRSVASTLSDAFGIRCPHFAGCDPGAIPVRASYHAVAHPGAGYAIVTPGKRWRTLCVSLICVALCGAVGALSQSSGPRFEPVITHQIFQREPSAIDARVGGGSAAHEIRIAVGALMLEGSNPPGTL